MSRAKILVVEDEPTLLEAVSYNLRKDGYDVVLAEDGAEAVELARSEKPDLILLDLMLPGLGGLDVCRIVRKSMTVPILILTAKDEEIDKVLGLELGADDYMTKPFGMRELMARVRALLRRVQMMQPEEGRGNTGDRAVLRVGEITLDNGRHEVFVRGVPTSLRPKEFDLLYYLMRNRGQVLSREVLLERVWGYDYAGDTRTVDVHVRWLREKIEADPSDPRLVQTVRNVGYKFGDNDVQKH